MDVCVVHNGQLTNYWTEGTRWSGEEHRFTFNCDSETKICRPDSRARHSAFQAKLHYFSGWTRGADCQCGARATHLAVDPYTVNVPPAPALTAPPALAARPALAAAAALAPQRDHPPRSRSRWPRPDWS